MFTFFFLHSKGGIFFITFRRQDQDSQWFMEIIFLWCQIFDLPWNYNKLSSSLACPCKVLSLYLNIQSPSEPGPSLYSRSIANSLLPHTHISVTTVRDQTAMPLPMIASLLKHLDVPSLYLLKPDSFSECLVRCDIFFLGKINHPIP